MKTNLFFKYGLTLIAGILFLQLEVFAQARTIRGTVTDSGDNSTIPGATVTIKGTNTATQTNVDGEYTIQVPGDNSVLVVSFVGMTSQEITVGSRSQINVALESDQATLDEVVVIGYGTARQKDLTGSVAIVNMNQLKAQPTASAVEALQGKATGVQIISDGAPGATPQIRIRGFSTINNNDPLFIIDGVPYEGKLSWLNQNDIESMQVLKDASSSSIYGARANNGVVIITTKKGTKGTAKLSFDAYYGVQSPRKNAFPNMLNPTQYAENLIKAYQNNPANAAVGSDATTGVNYGPGTTPILPDYLVAGGKFGHQVTAADADMSKYNYSRDPGTFYQITKANKAGTNWFEEITENAPIQNYQLSLSGGNDNSTYVVSGGYMNQNGIVKHTGYERFTIRSNTNFSAFNHRLRLGQNLQYSHDRSNGVGVNINTPGDYIGEGSVFGFAFRMPTIIPVYDEAGNFAGSRGNQLGNAQNPMALLNRAKDNGSKSNIFFGNAFAEIDIINNLTARTSFGVNYNTWSSFSVGYPNLEFSEGSNNNNLNESMGYGTNWTWTNTLTYKLNWASQRLTLLAGTEAVNNQFRNLSGSRNEFFILGNMDYYYLNTGSANIGNASSGGTNSLYSLFGRAEYSLNDKYLITGTLRRDGSSNFGPANKYGLFPAISGAWRISEESFLKDSEWINDLKLRVGYGVTGNQSIPGFQYLNRFSSSLSHSAYPIAGGSSVVTGVWQNAYNNSDVKWEEVKSVNVGLDFSLLKGIFDGSLDVFNKNTTDMLYPVPLPATATGMGSAPFVNIGDMNNRGVELSLNYHHGVKQKRAFEFDAGINFTHYKNKIVSLAPSVSRQNYGDFRSMQTSILLPGHAFGSFYGYNVIGIYQNDADLTNSATYTGARVGGLKYEDISGPDGKKDGVIDAYDRTIIGSPHPDFLYSISFNGRYKNFDLGLFFNGSQGNDLFEATRYYTDFSTFDGSGHERLLDAWSPSNTSSMIPSPYRGASTYEYNSSSYFVQDGSYLRLKNLQIGYTFPSKKLFNSKFERLRVYVSGTNLLTFTKYTGLDPEVSQTNSTFSALGVDFGVYPVAKQYLVGLSLGF